MGRRIKMRPQASPLRIPPKSQPPKGTAPVLQGVKERLELAWQRVVRGGAAVIAVLWEE